MIDSCYGLGQGHGSRVMRVTGHKMWPIVSSGTTVSLKPDVFVCLLNNNLNWGLSVRPGQDRDQNKSVILYYLLRRLFEILIRFSSVQKNIHDHIGVLTERGTQSEVITLEEHKIDLSPREQSVWDRDQYFMRPRPRPRPITVRPIQDLALTSMLNNYQ